MTGFYTIKEAERYSAAVKDPVTKYEGGNPVLLAVAKDKVSFPAQTRLNWIPAFAGMTGKTPQAAGNLTRKEINSYYLDNTEYQ